MSGVALTPRGTPPIGQGEMPPGAATAPSTTLARDEPKADELVEALIADAVGGSRYLNDASGGTQNTPGLMQIKTADTTVSLTPVLNCDSPYPADKDTKIDSVLKLLNIPKPPRFSFMASTKEDSKSPIEAFYSLAKRTFAGATLVAYQMEANKVRGCQKKSSPLVGNKIYEGVTDENVKKTLNYASGAISQRDFHVNLPAIVHHKRPGAAKDGTFTKSTIELHDLIKKGIISDAIALQRHFEKNLTNNTDDYANVTSALRIAVTSFCKADFSKLKHGDVMEHVTSLLRTPGVRELLETATQNRDASAFVIVPNPTSDLPTAPAADLSENNLHNSEPNRNASTTQTNAALQAKGLDEQAKSAQDSQSTKTAYRSGTPAATAEPTENIHPRDEDSFSPSSIRPNVPPVGQLPTT